MEITHQVSLPASLGNRNRFKWAISVGFDTDGVPSVALWSDLLALLSARTLAPSRNCGATGRCQSPLPSRSRASEPRDRRFARRSLFTSKRGPYSAAGAWRRKNLEQQPGRATGNSEELAQARTLSMRQILRWRSRGTRAQWTQFGQRLRTSATPPASNRLQLARKAKALRRDGEILEPPPPSRPPDSAHRRAGLKLTWAEVPGPRPFAPACEVGRRRQRRLARRGPRAQLLSGSRLRSAGAAAEQTACCKAPAAIWSSPGSTWSRQRRVAYLALCQHSLAVTELRSRLPREVAKRIEAPAVRPCSRCSRWAAGTATPETQLLEHLLEAGTQPCELGLLDLSAPLLTCAYRHAAERLSRRPSVVVWGSLGNFYHLPQYTALHAPPMRRPPPLHDAGPDLANLEHEPGFCSRACGQPAR